MNDVEATALAGPEAARQRRQIRRLTGGFIVSLLVLVAAVSYTIAVNINQGSTINKFVDSPCQRDAASRECQTLKIESDKARSPRSACVITRIAGYPGCPALERRGQKRRAQPRAAGGADATSRAGPPVTSGATADAADDGPSPAGASPVDDEDTATTTTTTTATTTAPSTTTPQERGPVGQILDDVGQLTDDAGDAVDQVGDTVHATTCNLTPALC